MNDFADTAWRQWPEASLPAFSGQVVLRLQDFQVQSAPQARLQGTVTLGGTVRYQARLEAELWHEEQLLWRRVRQAQLRQTDEDSRMVYLSPNLLFASFQSPHGLITRFMTDEQRNRRLLLAKGILTLYSDMQQFLKDDPLQERIDFGG